MAGARGDAGWANERQTDAGGPARGGVAPW